MYRHGAEWAIPPTTEVVGFLAKTFMKRKPNAEAVAFLHNYLAENGGCANCVWIRQIMREQGLHKRANPLCGDSASFAGTT